MMPNAVTRRRMLGATGLVAASCALRGAATLPGVSSAAPSAQPAQLRVASLEFSVMPAAGSPTAGKTGAVVEKVASGLKSTLTLLEDGAVRVCLLTMHFNSAKAANVSLLYRRAVAEELKLPVSNVVLCISHNHTDLKLCSNHIEAYEAYRLPASAELPEPKLLPVGEELLAKIRASAKRLPELLQPVTVWWSEGSEGRITYNRKGWRPDGTAYFMREEDRELLGADFVGDIDRQAPIVIFKNAQGQAVTALVQFTGHPCTCYHPEKPVVFGEWPQVACDVVASALSPGAPIPVSFLQGCAGDVNSKGMFRGDTALSERYGRMLGESYLQALGRLQASRGNHLDFRVEKVQIPLAPLPSAEKLKAELAEMQNFLRRVAAGDKDTLTCVGQNFSKELSLAYRSKLVEAIMPWTQWALDLQASGQAGAAPKFLEVDIQVLRVGDVGIACMPFEPFQGIGRQIRAGSKLPLTIPCGYANVSHGYLTDGPNTGDGEYMSAHYRYSKFRPPYQKPAGDAVAAKAVAALNQLGARPTP